MQNKTISQSTSSITLTPRAWEVQQGSRVFRVSHEEFVRSSYDFGQFTPLYGPDVLDALKERFAQIVEKAATHGIPEGKTLADLIRNQTLES